MTEDPADALPAGEQAAGANLGWSLGMVLRAWQEEVGDVLHGMPGSSRGYHVLSAVAHGGPQRQKALAERLAIDRTVLVYLIDDLVEAGLVERRLDPQDRRARRIVATERGRRVLAEAETRVSAAEERILDGISPADQAAFHRIATRAATKIRETSPGTDPCVAARSVLDTPA
ncbi:MarR family winged helix-turn-helix transcriptional regulator [Streptosporangium lutulentum]|uniref:DNA-binding MarR family transcriptional regulator n=1 Tax=Streptosporangium lutulentum TaxID=1461250 RepID=A0ABT9QAS8_9ACTN|nr:MarR family transcriptional regulator [Streptosporangium lutulentum]MDP9843880.1 DNA-binding MarR family transcriptional regulator [Streptosporangium lutulentum]